MLRYNQRNVDSAVLCRGRLLLHPKANLGWATHTHADQLLPPRIDRERYQKQKNNLKIQTHAFESRSIIIISRSLLSHPFFIQPRAELVPSEH